MGKTPNLKWDTGQYRVKELSGDPTNSGSGGWGGGGLKQCWLREMVALSQLPVHFVLAGIAHLYSKAIRPKLPYEMSVPL